MPGSGLSEEQGASRYQSARSIGSLDEGSSGFRSRQEVVKQSPLTVPTVVSGSTGGLIQSIQSSFDLSSIQSINDLVKGADHVIFHLFAGIDGASEAMRQQQFISADHKVLNLWFETDPWCQGYLRRRTSEWHRLVMLPDSDGQPSSVFALTDDDCANLASILQGASRLKTILVISGSPCVGFSNANPRGRGILDSESIKLWSVPVIVSHLRKLTLSQIMFLAENVIPKSKESERAITACFQVDPIVTHAHNVSPCRRSRLIWTNLSQTSESVDPIMINDCIEPGWKPVWSSDLCESKFGTFLRPFPKGRPAEYPASYSRLPLSSYDPSGLVQRQDLSPGMQQEISEKLLAIRQASGDPRDPNS